MAQLELFTIRQMIELTGLSEFTIRGWETRYRAFSPRRGETGRREYNKKDIERALLIRELLKRGHKIGKIATLSNQKLSSLFEQSTENDQSADPHSQNKIVTEALELMALQKWDELSALFKSVRYKSASRLIQDFLLPVLGKLALQVNSGLVSIAQEHVLSSVIKEKIYSSLSDLEKKSKVSKNKIRFVLAAPEGDYHELGLLLAHLLIRSYGFTSLYLGPHTPVQDLSETALRFEASHMLIVSTVSRKDGARQDLLNFVSDVQKKIGLSVRILIAGSQTPHFSREETSNLSNLESFHDLERQLEALKVQS